MPKKPNYDLDYDKVGVGEGAATVGSSAASGAATGAQFAGPWGAVIGAIGGGVVGGLDIGKKNRASWAEAEQQADLDQELADIDANFNRHLQSLALGSGQQATNARARAEYTANRYGVNPAMVAFMSDQAGAAASDAGANRYGSAAAAAVQTQLARQQGVLQQYESAQSLANNAADSGPSYADTFGQLAGTVSMLQGANTNISGKAKTGAPDGGESYADVQDALLVNYAALLQDNQRLKAQSEAGMGALAPGGEGRAVEARQGPQEPAGAAVSSRVPAYPAEPGAAPGASSSATAGAAVGSKTNAQLLEESSRNTVLVETRLKAIDDKVEEIRQASPDARAQLVDELLSEFYSVENTLYSQGG